jgi:hypothetical protein
VHSTLFKATALSLLPLLLQSVDVALLHPATVSSLMHSVGISSSAVALRMKPGNILTANLFNGQMVNYWNLWDYKQALYTFADGGKLLCTCTSCVAPVLRLPLLLLLCACTAGLAVHWKRRFFALWLQAVVCIMPGSFHAVRDTKSDQRHAFGVHQVCGYLLILQVLLTTWPSCRCCTPCACAAFSAQQSFKV